MKSPFPRFLLWLLCSTVSAAPATSFADLGDCGQPTSSGTAPTVADVLSILRAAVGGQSSCLAKPCVCDVDCDGKITCRDALRLIRITLSLTAVDLACCCPPDEPVDADILRLELRDSDFDYGWTGIAHDSKLPEGISMTLAVVKRCSNSQQPCSSDDDCGGGTCEGSCDSDDSCELAGPIGTKHCLTNLVPCATNDDCAPGVACVSSFGPPLPLSSGGTPGCVYAYHLAPVTGDYDTGSGELDLAMQLRWRRFLGITVDKPCPRCGAPDQNPRIGDEFTCDGGQFVGAACTVDAVHPVFGGTSFDCPPMLSANVTGAGLVLPLRPLTTGVSTRTAPLPCGNSAFRPNPLLPIGKCLGGAASGSDCSINADCGFGICNVPTCLDTGESCTSNADCRRCTTDPGEDCSDDGVCTGAGNSCAEAPDQPVTCGYWCNCGFCDGNPAEPCMQNSDCPQGKICQVGPGTGQAQNIPQQKPNDCVLDDFICGQDEDERCASTTSGTCSGQPFRSCTVGSATCQDNDAGECIIRPRPCFENRITRTGEPSPLGTYCALEHKTCTSNADCAGPGDFCASDSSRPEGVALFCMGGHSNVGSNQLAGLPGPVALRLNWFARLCRCGDSIVACDEECDDGNTAASDGCDETCRLE